MNTTLPQLNHLNARIRSVWSRDQTLHRTAGLLAFTRWAVVLFIIGMTIDWLIDIPTPGRLIILAMLLIIATYRGWRDGWKHLRAFDPTRTALQLESKNDGLNSLLVSAVQLRDAATAGTSEPLRDKTCQLADEAASTLRPEQAVPFTALRRPATWVVMLASIISIFGIINGPFLKVGLTRIFTPWIAIAYPTNTQLELLEGDLVIQEGASARIEATVSGIIPTNAKLLLQTGEGSPREMLLDITDGKCEYTIASASRNFTYQIKAGDARSEWHQVRVIAAPRFDQVNVELDFPDYLDRPTETVEALTLTVPEGTGVKWNLTLDQPISQAAFLRDGEEPMQLDISEDGRKVTFNELVSDSRGYRFSWVERDHEFKFTSSRYYLQVASDQPPRVELSSPESNLVAMLGRPLQLVVRAQDDHGIAATTIAYRVNHRPEETKVLETPIESGKGDQPIDWDYRTDLPDLNIGDTVAFIVEVQDGYPEPQGPHIVRSETRRITFLSKDEYLEQIGRKRDRLLSRVKTLYRQQRAAHDLVRTLNPNDDSYLQTCQLEAIRQEMVREQLKETSDEVQVLIDDLAANNVSDAPEGDLLVEVRSALQSIADTHIAQAATLLRDQSGATGNDTSHTLNPAPAARKVNTSARELAALVLLRGIDSAQEVYAREARMLAQLQASLRWRTVEADSSKRTDSLANEQTELAEWTHRLITDLQTGMRYEKRPLAVLRLIQSVRNLQTTETVERMHQAADLISERQSNQAERLQAKLVTTLLDAEFSVRLSGAYSTLIKTRDQIRSIVQAQTKLREESAAMSAKAFAANGTQAAEAQQKLRKRLLTLLLPTVPAPRPKLFDESLPEPPPIPTLLMGADRTMANAINQFAAGQQDAAIDEQRAAEQVLTHLVGLVDRWSVELGLQTLGLSTLVAVTGERLALIEEYEAKVVAILEKTDIAAADEQRIDTLAEPQLLLAEELAAFNSELTKQNESNSDKDIPPLLSRTERAEQALRHAVTSLKANNADEAIGRQEQAADILAEAFAIVTRQSEQLSLIQSLLMFQRSITFANGYMIDIVTQQRDMIEATDALETEDASHLMPMLNNLRQCMDEVAPLLDTVAARVDAGSPLAFAKSDLEDAVESLKFGDKLDALDAQDVVAESLDEVNQLVAAVKSQTSYVVEIVEFLHTAVADLTMLQHQQEELMRGGLSPTPSPPTSDQLKALATQQQALLTKAEELAQVLESVTGMPEFTEPAELMQEAVVSLESNDASAAAEVMEVAGAILQENAESLFAVISMLHGLPSIEIMTYTDPAIERLVNVLAVADAHKALYRETNTTESKDTLAQQQADLATRCEELSKVGEPHEMLTTASKQLAASATAMQASDQAEIKRNQQAALQSLRHFIIEQALFLETAVPPAAASEGSPDADGPGSDSESAFAAGFIADFVSGEAPKDQRTSWKVRGERNRAALNQNFARELPLEYRGLLKNYYERVAE